MNFFTKCLTVAITICLPAIGVCQQEIFYVNVRGYGESLNEARVTAARAALSEYVGTFIDASYSVEEKIQIENDYVTESSIIEENIFEYSQGVVRSIDVISGIETDGFYEIEARVGISKQETETFITEKLSEIREVNTGLFASIVTNRENRLGQFGIFDEAVWSPLDENTGVEVGISGEIVEASLEEYPDKADQGNIVLKIPITLKVNDSYLTRAVNALENISEYSSYRDNLFWSNGFPTVRDYDLSPIVRVFIGNLSYIPPTSIEMNGRSEFKPLLLPSLRGAYSFKYRANTEVRMFTLDGETAVSACSLVPEPYSPESRQKYVPNNYYMARVISLKIDLIGKSEVLQSEIISNIESRNFESFALLNSINDNKACRVFIDTTSSVNIFIEVNDTILSETVDIRIQAI